jgi:hypothetical protein
MGPDGTYFVRNDMNLYDSQATPTTELLQLEQFPHRTFVIVRRPDVLEYDRLSLQNPADPGLADLRTTIMQKSVPDIQLKITEPSGAP